MDKNFMSFVKERRSIYALGKDLPVKREAVEGIVQDALLHTPSPFNIQNSRAVLLFGAQSDKLWNIVKEELFKVVPPSGQADTGAKIDGFAAGAGTVLFFEDTQPTEDLKAKFKTYAHNFDSWSLQSIGMVQFVIWTAFAGVGIGASLQHYNELIEARVKKEWGVPDSWKLVSQMPFGKKLQDAGDKDFVDLDKRLKIKG